MRTQVWSTVLSIHKRLGLASASSLHHICDKIERGGTYSVVPIQYTIMGWIQKLPKGFEYF